MFKKVLSVFFVVTVLFSCIYNSNNIVYSDEVDKKGLILCEVLMEPSTKTLLTSVNGNVKIPVGTMAKLMTVLLVSEAVNEGRLSFDSTKKTSSYANSMKGAQIWLMPGEEMTISDLLKGVIIGNANDASVSLAEAVAGTEEDFVEKMNLKALELDMNDTVFTNCNGYYDDDMQISTAVDIAKLVSELSKPEHENLKAYFTRWLDNLRDGATELVNANNLVRTYSGITGFKAGFTENSGFCVAAGAERNGNTYISVVLGCDDKDVSFAEAKQLLNNGFTNYQKIKPDLPKNIPQTIKVKGGVEKEIPLHLDEIIDIVIPNGTFSSISSKIIIPDYVYAPVSSGQVIGEIQFLRNDKLLFSVNISADCNAEKLNLLKALGIILKFISTF